MKTIIITTKYGPIILVDNDNSKSKDQMIKELSELTRENNLTILKTSEASALVRPSLISGIAVYDDTVNPTKESTSIIETKSEIEPEELEQNVEDTPDEEIDIIKDMD